MPQLDPPQLDPSSDKRRVDAFSSVQGDAEVWALVQKKFQHFEQLTQQLRASEQQRGTLLDDLSQANDQIRQYRDELMALSGKKEQEVESPVEQHLTDEALAVAETAPIAEPAPMVLATAEVAPVVEVASVDPAPVVPSTGASVVAEAPVVAPVEAVASVSIPVPAPTSTTTIDLLSTLPATPVAAEPAPAVEVAPVVEAAAPAPVAVEAAPSVSESSTSVVPTPDVATAPTLVVEPAVPLAIPVVEANSAPVDATTPAPTVEPVVAAVQPEAIATPPAPVAVEPQPEVAVAPVEPIAPVPVAVAPIEEAPITPVAAEPVPIVTPVVATPSPVVPTVNADLPSEVTELQQLFDQADPTRRQNDSALKLVQLYDGQAADFFMAMCKSHMQAGLTENEARAEAIKDVQTMVTTAKVQLDQIKQDEESKAKAGHNRKWFSH